MGLAGKEIEVLLLEDEENDASLMIHHLKSHGYAPVARRVWDEAAFTTALDAEPDIVLADYTLPQFNAAAALDLIRKRGVDLPVIVVTGSIGEERAVECIRGGAADYLLKDRLTRLGPAVERALADKQARDARREAELELRRLKDRLEAENVYLQEEIKRTHNVGEIVGSSSALNEVLERVGVVAGTDATVLILGETGAGKELVARAVHASSRRRSRPLVKVNCAALSPTLIENELFGHARGAFTGATTQSAGRFELASGGTLFLDEIGELPIEVQSKLLRVLQDGELERVGDPHTIRVDVRVITATNRDLEAEVRNGKFRADLYYRLNVFPIVLPPLRQRRDDVERLARHFADKYGRKHTKRVVEIPATEIAALQAYEWPGNVRELENVIERAVITSRDGVLRVAELLVRPAAPVSAPAAATVPVQAPEPVPMPADTSLTSVEAAHIKAVLEQTGGRIDGPGGAAEVLAINPNTLRSRMKKLGVDRPVRGSR